MPKSLCESLASLPYQQLHRVVEQWEEKEDLSLEHWQEDFKRSVLLKLMELSKESRDRRQSLMLKVCVDPQSGDIAQTIH